MDQNDKSKLQKLWNMRNITVNEFIELVANHPNFKFLLTTAGAWFLFRWVIGIWIGGHALYFVYRIFNLVLN